VRFLREALGAQGSSAQEKARQIAGLFSLMRADFVAKSGVFAAKINEKRGKIPSFSMERMG
jgi:hypothetical protein